MVNAQRLLQYCQMADKRFPLYFKLYNKYLAVFQDLFIYSFIPQYLAE